MVQMELFCLYKFILMLNYQFKKNVSIKEKKTLFPIVFQSECSKITKRKVIKTIIIYIFIYFILYSTDSLLFHATLPQATNAGCWFLRKKNAFHSISQQSCWVQIQSCSQCIWLLFHCALHEGSILGNNKKCLLTLISQIAEVISFIECGSPKESKVTTLELGFNSPFTCKRLLQTLHLLFIAQYSERPKCLSIITCFSQNNRFFFCFF